VAPGESTDPPRVADSSTYWQVGHDASCYDARDCFVYLSAALMF
jgi:hypothetical protein